MLFDEENKPNRIIKLRRVIPLSDVIHAVGVDAYLKQAGLDDTMHKIAGTLHLTDEEYEALQRDPGRD